MGATFPEMIEPHHQPKLSSDRSAKWADVRSAEWPRFMTDVMGFPMDMLSAVQRTVQRRLLVKALDPLGCVRGSAEREHARFVLPNAAIDKQD